MHVDQSPGPGLPAGLPKTRLLIRFVTLTNFKSYFGTHRIGPFHRNFSAIIGPNGSGKSNLIDSMVFVFGKRASWMRLKHLRELIHNSALYGTCDHASVEVEFCDAYQDATGAWVDVPDSIFTICRTVVQSNDNFYSINGVRKQLRDVTDLLRSKGIDLDYNRFIILQGEVEQISLMKPRTGNPDTPGFLEYLEDIIGTAAYIQPIEELQLRQEKLEAREMESSDAFKSVEEDMARLTETRDQALAFLRHEKRVYQLTNLKAQTKARMLEDTCKQIEERLTEFKKEEERIHAEYLTQIEKQKGKVERFQRAKKEKNDLEAFMEKTTENLKVLEDRYNQVELEITEFQKRLERNRMEVRDNSRRRKRLAEEKEKTTKSFPKVEESLKQLAKAQEVANQEFETIVQRFQTEFDKNKLEINELNLKRGQIEKKKREMDRRIEDVEGGLETHRERALKSQEEVGELKTEHARALKDLETISKTADEIEKTLEAIGKAVIDATAASEKKRQEMSVLESKMGLLDADLRSKAMNRETHERRNLLYQRLISAQKEGKISGLRGRLGDLVAVSGEYEVAFTEAAFAGWNRIVVDTFAEGRNILEWVRANKLGTVGLIPLDKVRENPMLLTEMEGYRDVWEGKAQRLMDIIKVESEDIRMAAFSVLQNTLVCNNAAIANKIAYGQPRQRVVTRSGELFEKNGIVSGGGRTQPGTVRLIGMRVANPETDNQETAKAEAERRELANRLGGLGQELNAQVSKLNALKVDQKKLFDERTRKNVEIRNLRDKADGLAKIIHEKERDALDQDHAMKELAKEEETLKDLKKQTKKAAADIERLLSQTEGLVEKQNHLGGPEMIAARQKLEGIKVEIREKEDKWNRREAEIADFQHKIDRLSEETAVLKAAEEEIQRDIEAKMAENEEIFVKTNAIVVKLDESKKTLREKEAVIAESKADLVDLEKAMVEMKERRAKQKLKSEEANAELNKTLRTKGETLEAIAANRQDYAKVLADYNFMDDVDFLKPKEQPDYGTAIKAAAETPRKSSRKRDSSAEPSGRPGAVKGPPAGTQILKRSALKGDKPDWDRIFEVEVNGNYDDDLIKTMKRFIREIEERAILEREQKERLEPDLRSIEEFRVRNKQFQERRRELDNVRQNLQQTKIDLEATRLKRKTQFLDAFSQISVRLKETYQILTNGGDAELEMVNCFDPFVEGISYSVRPPQKSWKQMSKLSGGEKTLSSLAFIFALHYYKPNPVYLMDEIDAALDYRNVGIVARFVKERTKNAQFIVISLRNNMFDMANVLFGVFKLNDVTQTIRFVPEEANQLVLGGLEDEEVQEQPPQKKMELVN